MTCASPRSTACARSGDSGSAVDDFGPHHFPEVEHPLAVRRQQLRQQHQAIALGEQHEQLRDRGRQLHAADHLGDRGPLARRRHGRIEQHLFEETAAALIRS